jgi:hypothetical protein
MKWLLIWLGLNYIPLTVAVIIYIIKGGHRD